MAGGGTSIFISAGDPSGDIAGAHLIKQLLKIVPSLTFGGLGGRRMRALGQDQLVDSDRLAVLGFWEVARKFLFFRSLMQKAVRIITEKKPAAVILIDYPGFNLRLAARIRSLGIPIIYYISPQIWAWHSRRIYSIKENVDLMLLILPFEGDIYDRAEVNNRFVGHYLLDDMDAEYIKAPFDTASRRIVLMPGSRPQEVQRMLPVLLKTAALLSKRGNWIFDLAGVTGDIDYRSYLDGIPVTVNLELGRTREMIARSRLVLTSSGTATLETGLIGRPMVVIYKTGWITYQIARRLVKVDNIALINIAAGEQLVPELIQNEATPERIATAADNYLNDDSLSRATVGQLNKVADRLGGAGAAERAAAAVMEQIRC